MSKVSQKELTTTVIPTPSKEEGKRKKEKTVKTDYGKKQGGKKG